MARAEAVQRIDEPADVVFDFLAEGANNPRWQPLVLATEREGDTLGVGTRYRQSVRHPAGFRVTADYEVTAFDRPRMMSFQVVSGGPVRPKGTFELTPVDAGTTDVRYSLEYRPHGLTRLTAPLLAIVGLLFRWQTTSLSRAKRVIEAAGAEPGP